MNEARKAFVKNKITTLEKASQRISTGLWTDNADWILNQFHYYSPIANLEMGLDGMDNWGGAGAGPGCAESCCFEYQSCMINANSIYRQHIILWTVGGIVSGAGSGFAAGAIIPVVGNIWGSIYGGWLAGTAGYVLAIDTYLNDQQVCALNYKACIFKKNGN